MYSTGGKSDASLLDGTMDCGKLHTEGIEKEGMEGAVMMHAQFV
jgi:hypothetical protein